MDVKWTIMLLLLVNRYKLQAAQTTALGQCRDRKGFHSVRKFNLVSCSSCYGYLFRQNTNMLSHDRWLFSPSSEHGPRRLLADIHVTSLREEICRSLSRKDCSRWIQCCLAAEDCCQQQLKQQKLVTLNNGDIQNEIQAGNMTQRKTHVQYNNKTNTDKAVQVSDPATPTCPHTWDGYGCWLSAPPNSHLLQSCPEFLTILPDQNIVAKKECTANGTWYRDTESRLEWTDYTGCVDIKVFQQELDISVACCVVSLAFLIPAVAIFLSYRTLRSQPRIRLHVHLFLSFILTSVLNLTWEVFVVRDRMINPKQESVISRNSVSCKLLYLLTRYARSTNFLWMFCEGFFLHRLVANAFKPPTSIAAFAVLGWGAPTIPVVIYSVIKHLKHIKSCWLTNIGGYEWIIYLPNLVSLLANFVFLINILRILLTQVQVHPNEPRSYRRALKATAILVPLFGIQLFFIIYRPPFGSPGWKQYEIFCSFITQSQGFAVALILCYVNKEVFGLVRGTLAGYRQTSRKTHTRMNETHGTEAQESDPSDSQGVRGHPKVYVTQC